MRLSPTNVMPSMQDIVAYLSLVTVHGMMMVPAAESVQCVAGDCDSVPIRVRSEPIPISIIFVSFSGGDNRAELQRVLPTFLTCVSVVLHFLYSCGFYYFPDSEDAPGRRLAALPRRLFPCNDFHGSCSPDLSRSKRVCVTLLTWESSQITC